MKPIGWFLLCLLTVQALCAEGLRVVCSSSIPADWTRRLAGEEIHVVSLISPQTDPHAFQPTPEHVKRLLKADLIVGFDPLLEPWLKQIVYSNNLNDKVLWIGKPWISDQGDHLACCPEDSGSAKHTLLRRREAVDPHVWTDPSLVEAMGRQIHLALAKLSPAEAGPEGEARCEAFVRMTRSLDTELRTIFAGLPPGHRSLLTNHDNLGRIASRYGLRVEGVILRASTSEASDPSAREMVRFAELARKRAVRVIVIDRGQRAGAAETIAREAGLPPPLALRLDTLESEGPAASWEGMMRQSARLLAEALAR